MVKAIIFIQMAISTKEIGLGERRRAGEFFSMKREASMKDTLRMIRRMVKVTS